MEEQEYLLEELRKELEKMSENTINIPELISVLVRKINQLQDIMYGIHQ